jgi:hypothetical protein
MPRLPNNTGRDFSASLSVKIAANIAKLFASRPLRVDELFAHPIARMRIRVLIARAMNKPTKPQQAKSR